MRDAGMVIPPEAIAPDVRAILDQGRDDQDDASAVAARQTPDQTTKARNETGNEIQTKSATPVRELCGVRLHASD